MRKIIKNKRYEGNSHSPPHTHSRDSPDLNAKRAKPWFDNSHQIYSRLCSGIPRDIPMKICPLVPLRLYLYVILNGYDHAIKKYYLNLAIYSRHGNLSPNFIFTLNQLINYFC